jgi:hypothetical protein
MEEEITDADDYADLLKWVTNAERNKQAIFESTHYAEIPMLLQVQQSERGGLNNNSA